MITEDFQFIEPKVVNNPAECVFYHAYDLPISGYQEGHWDLRGEFDNYVANTSMAGKTVLDVGTASGFLSFEAAKRGANVVSVDTPSAKYWNRLPFVKNRAYTDRTAWELDANQYLKGIQNSYWLARKEFSLDTRVFYCNATELPASLGQFDIVIVGQILVHLRDTIEALTSMAARSRHTVIIAEGMTKEEEPVSHLLGRANNPEQDYTFWHHSVGFYREIMAMLGFSMKTVQHRSYICNLVPPEMKYIPISTLVFERTS